MEKKQVFKNVSDEDHKDYERLARLQYDPVIVSQSTKRWKGYTNDQRESIMDEGNRVYTAIVAAIEAGKDAQSSDVQALMTRWHDHLRHFYEPTLEILRGLGELYNTDPAFMANFARIHPELAGYMQQAITVYVDALEDAELRRMLDEDDVSNASGRLAQ